MKQEPAVPMLSYWYQALSSPYGVELICSDIEHTRQHLYRARKESRDLDLDQLGLCISPFDPSRLWIIRKDTKNGSTP
jgi:tricorn protease-like protein